LLASVSTHSLAVVAARLAATYRAPWLLAAAWLWWVLGLALYVLVIVPLARRALRGGIELDGDHWIVMGALAIAGLAASGLVRASSKLGWAGGFGHVARAGEVALWIAATLLVPALLVVEARAWPPALGIERWSTVFPLGMYSAATYALRSRTGTDWLETVATVFLWIAVAVLVAVAMAAMRGLPRSLRPRWRSRRA
jgi:tellurite resistance protein TehA-like permease